MIQDWRQDAACKGKDPNIFFAEDTSRAKRICATCTVIHECLANAEPDGVWGGLDEKERRKLKYRRKTA